MGDGYDLHLDAERASRLQTAADEAGLTLGDYAIQVLDRALEADSAEDVRRLAEYQRTGQSISVDDWVDELRRTVAKERRASAWVCQSACRPRLART
jgi:hypothetical protein